MTRVAHPCSSHEADRDQSLVFLVLVVRIPRGGLLILWGPWTGGSGGWRVRPPASAPTPASHAGQSRRGISYALKGSFTLFSCLCEAEPDPTGLGHFVRSWILSEHPDSDPYPLYCEVKNFFPLFIEQRKKKLYGSGSSSSEGQNLDPY